MVVYPMFMGIYYKLIDLILEHGVLAYPKCVDGNMVNRGYTIFRTLNMFDRKEKKRKEWCIL